MRTILLGYLGIEQDMAEAAADNDVVAGSAPAWLWVLGLVIAALLLGRFGWAAIAGIKEGNKLAMMKANEQKPRPFRMNGPPAQVERDRDIPL